MTEPTESLVREMTMRFLECRPRWLDIGENGDPGLCEYASHELVGFAASYGLDGEVECITRSLVPDGHIQADRRYPKEAIDAHWVVRFGPYVVDLTARQFDDDLPFPFYWTVP